MEGHGMDIYIYTHDEEYSVVRTLTKPVISTVSETLLPWEQGRHLPLVMRTDQDIPPVLPPIAWLRLMIIISSTSINTIHKVSLKEPIYLFKKTSFLRHFSRITLADSLVTGQQTCCHPFCHVLSCACGRVHGRKAALRE